MKTLVLIIEKTDDGYLGRVNYQDNLIVEEADSVEELEKNIKNLLHDFHDLDEKKIKLEKQYDLTVLFEKFSYLKISVIAAMAGINASQMRQYAIGAKNPKPSTAKKIEETLHRLADDLKDIRVYT